MNNILSNHSLHDCEVVSISTDRRKRHVVINLIDHTGTKNIRMTLDGVHKMYCTGLSMQNVILDAQIFMKKEKSEYYDFCQETLGLSNNFFEEHPNLAVLYLEPSVGLELACIFSEISIE